MRRLGGADHPAADPGWGDSRRWRESPGSRAAQGSPGTKSPGGDFRSWIGCHSARIGQLAHTHLELSDCRPGPRPTGGFAAWLVGMLQRTRIPPREMERAVISAVAIGIQQSLRFGVTTLGDISRQCRLTRAVRTISAPRRQLRRSPGHGPAAGTVAGTLVHRGR